MNKYERTRLYSVKKLAEQMSVSFDSLSRVMQKMAKQGFISSEQGKSGGYRLSCDFSQKSLYDLIFAIQGPVEIVKCLSLGDGCSMESQCDVKSPISFLNDKLVEFYKTISLADLLIKQEERLTQRESVLL